MSGVLERVLPTGTVACRCSNRHVPKPTVIDAHHIWPRSAGGPTVAANLVWLCPTAHRNVHELLEAWHRAGKMTPVPGHNRFIVSVARAGWEAMQSHNVQSVGE
jgi:hypothetical protein